MTTVNLSSFTLLSSADILNRLKQVDGVGSGLDAEFLGGQNTAFYRNAANLNAGTIPVARMPALTGIVTTTAGGVATTIADGAIPVVKLETLPALTLLGNADAGVAAPTALSASAVKTLLALSNVDNTSDADKPISTAAQQALDAKAVAPIVTATVPTNVGSTTHGQIWLII